VTEVRGGLLKRIFSAGHKLGEAPFPLSEATAVILNPVQASAKLARAVFDRMVCQEEGATRRIQMAIGWHAMAMANAPAVTWQQRIIAIKTGFEALFGESKSWKCAAKLRACFEKVTNAHRRMLPWSGLLWSPKERTDLARSWKNDKGEEHPAKRSEIEDWFMTLAKARNDIIHDGEASISNYEAPPERPLSRYARWHKGSLFWVGERVLREAIKAHLGPEILLAGRFARFKAMEDLVKALRSGDRDEPSTPEEEDVPPLAEPDEEPQSPSRNVPQLLAELACQGANHIELARASAAASVMWIAEVGERSLLISEGEKELLLKAGAEESIPDDCWDAG
jgi:hypothetical protein